MVIYNYFHSQITKLKPFRVDHESFYDIVFFCMSHYHEILIKDQWDSAGSSEQYLKEVAQRASQSCLKPTEASRIRNSTAVCHILTFLFFSAFENVSVCFYILPPNMINMNQRMVPDCQPRWKVCDKGWGKSNVYQDLWHLPLPHHYINIAVVWRWGTTFWRKREILIMW